MKKKYGDTILMISKLISIFVMTLIGYECFNLFYNPLLEIHFYWKGLLLIAVVIASLYILFTGIYDAFDLKLSSIPELVYSQLLATLFTDGIMFMIIFFIMKKFPYIIPAIGTFIIQLVFIIIWANVSKRIYQRFVPAYRTAVIYDEVTELKEIIASHSLDSRFNVSGSFKLSEIAEKPELIENYDVIFISEVVHRQRNDILGLCIKNGITAFVIPAVGDMYIYGGENSHMLHLPVIKVERSKPSFSYSVVKRMLDIFLALFFIIALSPVFLITAIAVKLCDKGPVFYRQTRLTKDGKQFKIIKFRSMRVDAEKLGVQLSTGADDPRVTKVGKIIRSCRLDELPQLFNILMGDMSFVGPRPERPELAAEYCKDYPEFSLRLQVKAGLTGYAQVYGKYNTTAYDKLKMDLMYIAHPSIAKDFALLFATVKILFVPDSTEGVSKEQVEKMIKK